MQRKDVERVWPERLKIRDTGLHDDLGGPGQRIYTTAGRGYERVEYVRADLYDALLAERDAALAAAPQPAPVDREDVERLATELERQDEYAPLGHVGWEAATTLRALLNRAEAAEAEALEQARLNGMGAERELALMGEIERLRKRLPV